MFINHPFLHLRAFSKKLKNFLLYMVYIAFSKKSNSLGFLVGWHIRTNKHFILFYLFMWQCRQKFACRALQNITGKHFSQFYFFS